MLFTAQRPPTAQEGPLKSGHTNWGTAMQAWAESTLAQASGVTSSATHPNTPPPAAWTSLQASARSPHPASGSHRVMQMDPRTPVGLEHTWFAAQPAVHD